MDVEDAENAVLVSSVILNSRDSQQNEVLSCEDLAWVDSCLIKDSDISESDWIPLRDALLEIIGSYSQSFNADSQEDNERLPYREEKIVGLELNLESSTSDVERLPKPYSTYNVNPLSVAVETSTNGILDNEKTGSLPSSTFEENAFLPTYNEDLNQNETFDLGHNLDATSYEMEHTYENIFKIWDLDIPSEEGELVKQLDKALSENSFLTVPSTFNDSGKAKDLNEGSLDDLINGIADLSINKKV